MQPARRPRHSVSTPVEVLVAMDDKGFEEVVNLETRGKAPKEFSEALRDPEICRRWYDILLTIKLSIDGQLAALEAERNALQAEAQAGAVTVLGDIADLEHKRAGMLRFKSGVEMTMVKARAAVRQAHREDEGQRLRLLRDEMTDAIRRHAETCHDPSDLAEYV